MLVQIHFNLTLEVMQEGFTKDTKDPAQFDYVAVKTFS